MRIAVHVHSDWSYDGRWSLGALAAGFARRGYDAVLMAEHDRGFDEERWQSYREACTAASTDVLLVPGIEYADAEDVVHVPVWGDIPFLGAARPTLELLRDATSAGGVAFLAHPDRRDAWRRVDVSWLPHLRGIEIWNRKYDGWAPGGRGLALLGRDPHLLPLASLDFHTGRQFFPLALHVDAERSEGSVVAALARGDWASRAFRLDVARASAGTPLAVARSIERVRRPSARAVRRVVDRPRG